MTDKNVNEPLLSTFPPFYFLAKDTLPLPTKEDGPEGDKHSSVSSKFIQLTVQGAALFRELSLRLKREASEDRLLLSVLLLVARESWFFQVFASTVV